MANLGNRIKDPEAVILLPNHVLLEVIKKPSKILSVDPNNPHNIDYIRICKLGEGVGTYKEGDVVLESDTFQQVTWETNERFFVKTLASNLKLVVREDNFLPEEDNSKPKLTLN